MNVCGKKVQKTISKIRRTLNNEDLDKKFVAEGRQQGLHNLAGHRSIGGMRASIYNAMPAEGVDALIEFMKKFEAENK